MRLNGAGLDIYFCSYLREPFEKHDNQWITSQARRSVKEMMKDREGCKSCAGFPEVRKFDVRFRPFMPIPAHD